MDLEIFFSQEVSSKKNFFYIHFLKSEVIVELIIDQTRLHSYADYTKVIMKIYEHKDRQRYVNRGSFYTYSS